MDAFLEFFRTIRGKLCLLLLGVLVPILIIKGFDYYHRYLERRSNEYQADLDVARAVSTTFEEYVHNILLHEFAIGFSFTYPHPPSPPQMNHILAANLRHYPEMRNFAWVNPKGRVIASSMESTIGTDLSDRIYLGVALLHCPKF